MFNCQTSRRRSIGHFWEFTGGKIEGDETPEECLRREMYEELQIHVEVGEFFVKVFMNMILVLFIYWYIGCRGKEIPYTQQSMMR